jgi:hypothetical protein
VHSHIHKVPFILFKYAGIPTTKKRGHTFSSSIFPIFSRGERTREEAT